MLLAQVSLYITIMINKTGSHKNLFPITYTFCVCKKLVCLLVIFAFFGAAPGRSRERSLRAELLGQFAQRLTGKQRQTNRQEQKSKPIGLLKHPPSRRTWKNVEKASAGNSCCCCWSLESQHGRTKGFVCQNMTAATCAKPDCLMDLSAVCMRFGSERRGRGYIKLLVIGQLAKQRELCYRPIVASTSSTSRAYKQRKKVEQCVLTWKENTMTRAQRPTERRR